MEYFNKYVSNTTGGSGNQTFFCVNGAEVHSGRVYYKIYAGGCFSYSLMFSNVLDSTFADGSETRCNMSGDEWKIQKVSVGICRECDGEMASVPTEMKVLTFQKKESRIVRPGDIFFSDEFELEAEKDEYLCVEIAFSGIDDQIKESVKIPCHEESILPAFILEEGKWIPSRNFPFPSMIGCNRHVQRTIGFWGDSITQGCGTPVNTYSHWCALVAENMGEQYAYWNLGLGYGRAQDAASDGVWMQKAKQMDWIVLCFGTNDIGQHRTEEEIKADLLTIIEKLQNAGVKVLLQTMPPFSWQGEALEKWININQYIRNILSEHAEGFFDIAPLLTDGPEESGKAKYIEHPNEDGCRVWANALLPVLRNLLQDK